LKKKIYLGKMADWEKIFDSLKIDDIYNRTGVHVRKGGRIPDLGSRPAWSKKAKYFHSQSGSSWGKKNVDGLTSGELLINQKKHPGIYRNYQSDKILPKLKSRFPRGSPEGQEIDKRMRDLKCQNPGMRFDIRAPKVENNN
jgi:hypothetical protein